MAEHPIEGMMGVTMEKSASWWMPIPSLANRSRWMEQPSSPFPALPLALPPAALMLAQKPTSRCLAAAPARAFHCTHRVFGDQRRQCAHHQLVEHVSPVDSAINALPDLVDRISALIKKDKPETPQE